jgi:UDP-N-acetylglucosamine 2-epimerase (non-hydrolysing)/GDP/UDP-N,N'-diacetylbacillosamine 2-epimerase (hydrolysing)
MLVSGDTPTSIAKSMGLGTIGFADTYEKLRPDIVVVLGDRFELLSAAQAALVLRIPLAHIAGGDTTEGAYDEAIRHSITKMAHLHFVTNELSAKRVLQLGENPKHVFNVGSPGLDYIKHVVLLDRSALEQRLSFRLRPRNLLITFHPATLGRMGGEAELGELLAALESLDGDVGFIFTESNADNEGGFLNEMISQFVERHGACACVHDALGSQVYLSTMAHVDAVVGNSSSGFYETPSFKKPTVNIGDRQKGRLRAASVLDCEPGRAAIERCIRKAFELDCSGTANPYGDGESAPRIVSVLRNFPDFQTLLQKHFFMQ